VAGACATRVWGGGAAGSVQLVSLEALQVTSHVVEV
jgi:hypothetical protein